MNDKVVITAGLSGSSTVKSQNPGVPYRPEEWAAEVRRCEDAGAAVIAVHFKDYDTGEATVDSVVMRETMDAITSNCNCIVNLSTGVGENATLEDRKEPILQHRPEMASLNPGSINFNVVNWRNGEIILDDTYVNPYEYTLKYAQIMKDKQIKPENECFAPSHIENVLWMRQYHDLWDDPLHFGLVFGVAGGMQLSASNLANCLALMPSNATWMGVGVGPNCMNVAMAAASLGGHIRVGLEDNLWLDNTTKALSKGSYDQVEQAVKMGFMVGRAPASPDETREIFNLRAADA